jgi:hypothetical protein
MAADALLSAPEFTSIAPDTLQFTTPASKLTFQVFWGYLLCDSAFVVYYNTQWAGWQATFIHHGCALCCWGHLLTGDFGHTLGLIAILAEFTTPFVNARWFLDKLGMKSSQLYFYNGLAMTFSWFIFR